MADETKIPVFSVLKKGVIHKNIVLNIPPHQPDTPILIGRHPDCHIVLDHPSISRFHLDLRPHLPLRQLAVTDHSSVHGTWISGRRIEPNVAVGMSEGDTLRIGASTREYRLRWVERGKVDEMDQPLETLVEEDEEISQQDNWDENWVRAIPSAPPMQENMEHSVVDEPHCLALESGNSSLELELGGESKSITSVDTLLPITEENMATEAPFEVELPSLLSSRLSLIEWKEPGEESKSLCSDVQMQDSRGTSSPKLEENKVTEAPFEVELPSPLSSAKKNSSSSLLSRRRKSVGSLRIHNDNVGSQLQESNDSERLCRVLFDNVKESEEDAFDSITENVELKRLSLTESKEPGEESKSMCSDVQMQDSRGPSSPKLEENKVTEALFEVELPSPLSSAKKNSSSSLLSRRRNSVGSLRIHNDNVGSQLQESNDSERLCRILFDNLKESEEDAFDSITENVELKRLSLTEWKEPGEENKSMCSDVQMQDSRGPSSPKLEENKVTEAPFEVELPSPLSSAKKNSSSSLLSRRRKSVGSLRIHNDNVGSQLQESNDFERLCRVLFDNVKESEEDAFDSITENVELKRLSLTESKEPGEERKSLCSDVQMQDSRGPSSPKLEENKVTENTSFAGEMPFERDHQSSLGSAKKTSSSSLLSRRRKSVDPLLVPAGDVGSDMQYATSPVFKNLFDSMEGENEETFDSVKENVKLSSSLTATVLNSDEENGIPGVLECKYTDTLMPVPLIFVKNVAEEASPYQNKENLTPNYSSGRKPKKSILGLQRSPSNELALLNGGDVSVNRMKDENEEPFAHSYKENLTPCTSSGRKLKNFLMSQRSASNDLAVLNEEEQMFSPDIFTPNKENRTPKVSGTTRTVKSLSKSHDRVLREVINKRVERVPFQCLLENSPSGNNDTFEEALYSPADQAICSPNCMNISKQEDAASGSNKDNLTPKGSTSQKSKQHLSNSADGIQREEKMKKGAERVPFQPFMNNSFPRNNNAHNSSNQHTSQVLNKAGEEKKAWNIVVDASCLLDDQSRKSLELLEGLKGTYLIIPRIVIRELDCMKRREGLFSRTRKASSALGWIETCMMRSSWWIHVQSSFEMLPVAATPPAFPSVQPINGSNAASSSSKPFSSCGSLLEIVTPTAEDHILDCALLFKKLRNDAQFVLLTHSVTLKIKALAEGLICEAPNEFRESLVNPYSKRFLWVNSSPRGRTWSTLDEQMAPDENYYHHFPVSRKVAKPGEGAKGLKLILPRDFHYEKTNLV